MKGLEAKELDVGAASKVFAKGCGILLSTLQLGRVCGRSQHSARTRAEGAGSGKAEFLHPTFTPTPHTPHPTPTPGGGESERRPQPPLHSGSSGLAVRKGGESTQELGH